MVTPRRTTLRLTPPKEPDPLEAVHQEKIFLLVEQHKREHPELAELFAVPNGGYRHKATAEALKRQGVRSGVPDMILPTAHGGHFGLYLELKRFREGTPTPEQIARIKRLQAAGYRAVVCRGWQSAWAELLRYVMLPPTVPTSTPSSYNPFAEFPALSRKESIG